MNVKFNLGNNNGKVNDIKADELKEDDDFEDDDDDEDDEDDNDKKTSSKSKKSSSNDNDFVKFIIKLVAIIGGGIILLFIILSIASSFSGGRTYTYEEIEEIMTNAAVSYFKDYPESLPKSESQIIEVEIPTLVQAGKMKDLSAYTKKGISCTGKVSVSKAGSEYVYTPTLNCGENYSSKTLSSSITENTNIVTSGYGLYNLNNELVFRGEKVDNYVKIGESIWRIVKLDSSKNIYLIKEGYAGYTAPWDDRYNDEFKYKIGVNNYSSSRIKEYLESLYNETKEDLLVFTAADKTKISSYDVCTGKRTTNSRTNNNSLECKTTEKSQRMGLLTVSDYINASIDPKCITPESPSCQNYNYLATRYSWWTATAVTNTTSEVFAIAEDGHIKVSRCSEYNYVRPVIKISSRTMTLGGTGTETDPYIIK